MSLIVDKNHPTMVDQTKIYGLYRVFICLKTVHGVQRLFVLILLFHSWLVTDLLRIFTQV